MPRFFLLYTLVRNVKAQREEELNLHQQGRLLYKNQKEKEFEQENIVDLIFILFNDHNVLVIEFITI